MASADALVDLGGGWPEGGRKFPRPRLVEPISSSDEATEGFGFGRALAGRNLDRIVDRVAPPRVSVLVTGETGVGKVVLAHRLHDTSPRAAEALHGRELRRVHRDAHRERALRSRARRFHGRRLRRGLGLFETADGGTVFLDEVAELSPRVQAKLLRVLDTHRLKRLGGCVERSVDVRVIAATSRDLGDEVAQGAFAPICCSGSTGAAAPPAAAPASVGDPAGGAAVPRGVRAARRRAAARTLSQSGRLAPSAPTPGQGTSMSFATSSRVATLLCDGDRIEPLDLGLDGGDAVAPEARARALDEPRPDPGGDHRRAEHVRRQSNQGGRPPRHLSRRTLDLAARRVRDRAAPGAPRPARPCRRRPVASSR